MPSLMVGIPTFDGSIKGKCVESVGNAIEYADANGIFERVVHRYPRGYSIARARNFMAQWAIDEHVTHLLMVDSDMVLPTNAIASLMERDVDVCLGFYVRGTSDDGTTNFDSHSGRSYKAAELAAMSPKLVEVKRGGFGCALLNVDVFERFSRPWFVYHDKPDGTGLSEDYDFCRKCRNAGLKIWVDANVACGHIHDRVLEAM